MSATVVVSELACDHDEPGDECKYQVAWAINPHMQIGAASYEIAAAQHAAYIAALEAAGANVVRLPFVHAAYDCVFAKDPALLVQRDSSPRALLASMKCRERQPERRARALVYARLGYDVIDDSAAPHWEGGDTVMSPTGQGMFLGHGPRSRADAVAWLERHLDIPVTPLELVDPRLYHLDMALTVLPDGCALVCEQALTRESMQRLERAPGIRSVVAVPRSEALGFGLNMVAVGKTVVCGARQPRIAAVLEARGFEQRVVPLDEFHKAGGSASCLSAVVHPEPRPVVSERPRSSRRVPDIYGAMFRKVIQPVWETRVRRRPLLDYHRQLEESQWHPLERLREQQAYALRKLVRHAYAHVPFYRQRFDAAGIRPDSIRSAEDLLRLPVLRRAELHGPTDRRSDVAPNDMICKQTSGTTGEPLLFGFEQDSEQWRRALKMRGYGWAGLRPGDRTVHFWGARLPTQPPLRALAKVALDRALHREHYFPCDVMSDERLHEAAELIERVQPRALICYAQAGAELARFIHRNRLRAWNDIAVICGAERLTPSDRADLQVAFGPRVFDTYGCREVMLIGAECEEHAGLHVSMENLVVEIVVTEHGVERLARAGETGEVVITDLHNLAMPFIRYANGDVATAGSQEPCRCGRTLPRIDAVQGRISEALRDGHGAAINGLAISFLFHDIAAQVRQFQAIQHRDHSVSINVILQEDAAACHLPDVQRRATELLAGLSVRVNAVRELPRTQAGKHRLVIVER